MHIYFKKSNTELHKLIVIIRTGTCTINKLYLNSNTEEKY